MELHSVYKDEDGGIVLVVGAWDRQELKYIPAFELRNVDVEKLKNAYADKFELRITGTIGPLRQDGGPEGDDNTATLDLELGIEVEEDGERSAKEFARANLGEIEGEAIIDISEVMPRIFSSVFGDAVVTELEPGVYTWGYNSPKQKKGGNRGD